MGRAEVADAGEAVDAVPWVSSVLKKEPREAGMEETSRAITTALSARASG